MIYSNPFQIASTDAYKRTHSEIHKLSLYLIKSLKRSFQKQTNMITFVTAVLNVLISWL